MWTVSTDTPGKSEYGGGKFGHVLGLEALGYSLGHYPVSFAGPNPQADAVISAQSVTLGMQWQEFLLRTVIPRLTSDPANKFFG